MIMSNIYRKMRLGLFASTALVGLLTSSCGDFLEITPLNAVVVENFWEKKSEVENVVTSCYYNMQNAELTKRLIVWSELRSDNVSDNSALTNNEDLYNFYTNNITTMNPWNSWSSFYDVINLCNTVLYYAPQAQQKDGNFSMDELHAYEAEALSIRALCYFYLIRTFQKVPLITKASIGDDEDFKVAANDEATVLKQIKDDLKWSLQYIWSKNYFDDVRERKGRFNTQSVYALLADISLWEGDYESCLTYTQKIMDDKLAEYKQQSEELLNNDYDLYMNNGALALYEGYPLLDGSVSYHYPYSMLFYQGNSFESIFEVQYDYTNRSNGNEGLKMFYGDNSNTGSGMLNAASWMVDQSGTSLFSDKNDVRLLENTGYDGVTTSSSYPIFKYRATWLTDDGLYLRTTAANWVVYRLTDVMLMRAEALAYIGGDANCEEAFSIVKAVNERSCGGVTKLSYNKDNIKQLVLDERQRELMFEGKRWYDLVRMVRHSESPTQTMSVLRNTYLMRKYQKNGQDAVTRLGSVNNLYLPFHQDEIDVNPLLAADQNPAYVY